MLRSFPKVLIGLALLFTACDPERPTPVSPPSTGGKRAWVVCEGSLGNGNSSLTLYRPEVDSVYEDVFQSVNGQSLGDVFQSITLIGEQYFLCINNSDKIVVINRSNYSLAGVIPVSKPRYILPVSPTKAYVSSIFSNQLAIINPLSLQQTGSISLPSQNSEGLRLINGMAYVCSWDTSANHVYVLNTDTDIIEDTLFTAGRAPQEVVQDKEGMLWVLSGNVSKGKQAAISCFDPATGALIKSFQFPIAADPLRFEWNLTRDTLYFIEVNYNGGSDHNGIYRMSIHASALPSVPFIAAQPLQYFWALGIEPGSGNVYIGEPKGFNQKGTVSIFRPDGSHVRSFNTGVGPGHFFFDY